MLLGFSQQQAKAQKLFTAGAKLLFRKTRKSFFDVLTATRPGDLVAAGAKSW